MGLNPDGTRIEQIVCSMQLVIWLLLASFYGVCAVDAYRVGELPYACLAEHRKAHAAAWPWRHP
jgi:hypothetical protein